MTEPQRGGNGGPPAARSSWWLWAVAACLLAGCGVHVRVEPLSSHRYPEQPRGYKVEALDAEPARPHLKLARVIATSEYGDEDDLDATILDSARRLGADAVVMGRMDVLEGQNISQSYESTNDADQNNTIFGGAGSGIPYFFDPWTTVQGADRVDYVNYKSGLAIRYLPGAAGGS
jgi:hypothetical protein